MDNNLKGLNAWLPQSEPTAEKPFKGEDGNYYEHEIEALLAERTYNYSFKYALRQMSAGFAQISAELAKDLLVEE